MIKYTVIVALLFGSLGCSAQQIASRPNDRFGISPGLALPTGNQTFKPGVSFDASLFYEYSLGYLWSLSAPLGVSLLNVEEHDNGVVDRYVSLFLQPSIKRSIPELDGSKIILGLKPYYNLYSRRLLPNPSPEPNLASLMNSRLGTGAYLGLQLSNRLKSNLEIGYTYNFGNTQQGFIDGSPNHLSLRINLNFNRNLINKPAHLETSENLVELSNDTLYVISRLCPEDSSIIELESLFAAYYDFSAYRILTPQEIDIVVKNESPLFFAVVGRYYKSKGDPETLGIYLLNGDLSLTKYPYPTYSYLPFKYLRPDYCFETTENLVNHIKLFNSRLKARQRN